jgi:hypothetical protein
MACFNDALKRFDLVESRSGSLHFICEVLMQVTVRDIQVGNNVQATTRRATFACRLCESELDWWVQFDRIAQEILRHNCLINLTNMTEVTKH